MLNSNSFTFCVEVKRFTTIHSFNIRVHDNVSHRIPIILMSFDIKSPPQIMFKKHKRAEKNNPVEVFLHVLYITDAISVKLSVKIRMFVF